MQLPFKFKSNESIKFDKSLASLFLFVLQVSIAGSVPEPRHSHTACSHPMGGAVVFGGLNKRGAPLGDVVLLRPNGSGFTWETLAVQPSPVPRFVPEEEGCFTGTSPIFPILHPAVIGARSKTRS